MRIRCTAAIAVSLTLLASGVTAAEWSYEGAEGPEYWGSLSKDFSACARGRQQSPIDIAEPVNADAANIELNWNPEAAWSIENNGHTIQLNTEDGGFITIGNTEYELVQFHFHAPSEHAFNGDRTEMEAHFVHAAADGRLAVIGVMMTGGGDNSAFSNLVNAAPSEENEADFGQSDPSALLTNSKNFVRYEGSLTTPPCSENVLWTVLKEPMAVSDEAIEMFKSFYDGNARPLQQVNRRYVLSK